MVGRAHLLGGALAAARAVGGGVWFVELVSVLFHLLLRAAGEQLLLLFSRRRVRRRVA
jgi:hypothetical protein